MHTLKRQFIDWKRTGRKLEMLRMGNLDLRHNVCRALKHSKGNCSGDCANCEFDMDNYISRAELADVFGVSDNVICNWESGKTPIGLEDILFYCEIAKVEIGDIIVYHK